MSPGFKASDRQKSFLRYAVDRTLEGRRDLLKEYCVGVEVFGRGESFDPRLDNVVRTEARRLRQKLADYYEAEGSADPLRIEFLKGHYSVVFRRVAAPSEEYSNDRLKGEARSFEAAEAAFVGGYQPLADTTASQAKAVPKVAAPVQRFQLIRGLVFVLIGLVAISAFAGAWLHFVKRRGAVPPVTPSASIAVLPLVDLRANGGDEFLSEGLADELINSLAQIPGLHVVARSSAFQFKGTTLDVREIGRRLHVRTVLEGSIRKAGDRVRIGIQLEDASDGYQLWTQTYDRQLKDSLDIQREIAHAVTNALGVEFAQGKPYPAAALPQKAQAAPDPEAYQDFLKGRYFSVRTTPGAKSIAVSYFEKAVARDPGYAEAYAALAEAYYSAAYFGGKPNPAADTPRIRATAFKALQMDGSQSQAHMALADTYATELNWTAAQQEYEKSLKLNAGDARLHYRYAMYLKNVGRLDEALKESTIAKNLDPVSVGTDYGVASVLYNMRRYDDAIREDKIAMELNPNDGTVQQGLAMAYLRKGMCGESIAEFRRALPVSTNAPNGMTQLGYALAVCGQNKEALAILNEALGKTGQSRFPAIRVAQIYIGLGNKDKAFEWLNKSVDEQSGGFSKPDPMYDPLRSDPRFAVLLHRMNLTP